MSSRNKLKYPAQNFLLCFFLLFTFRKLWQKIKLKNYKLNFHCITCSQTTFNHPLLPLFMNFFFLPQNKSGKATLKYMIELDYFAKDVKQDESRILFCLAWTNKQGTETGLYLLSFVMTHFIKSMLLLFNGHTCIDGMYLCWWGIFAHIYQSYSWRCGQSRRRLIELIFIYIYLLSNCQKFWNLLKVFFCRNIIHI